MSTTFKCLLTPGSMACHYANTAPRGTNLSQMTYARSYEDWILPMGSVEMQRRPLHNFIMNGRITRLQVLGHHKLEFLMIQPVNYLENITKSFITQTQTFGNCVMQKYLNRSSLNIWQIVMIWSSVLIISANHVGCMFSNKHVSFQFQIV